MQVLHRHAVQPLTRDDLDTLPGLRRAAGAIGTPDPEAAAYDRAGRPIAVGPPEPPEPPGADGGDTEAVRRCPPALAAARHDPRYAAEPLLKPDSHFEVMRKDGPIVRLWP